MFFLLISSLFLLILFHELYWKRRNFPPGPIPLPLIGNLLSLRNPPPGYEAFIYWRKKYGDIYTFWVGTRPYLLISGLEALKETFVKDGEVYADKKPMSFQESFRGGSFGIVETNGDFWRTHRRFALHQFKDFGLGKDRMQERILIEIRDIFERCDQKILEGQAQDEKNKGIFLKDIFDQAIGNIINQMMFGYRFEKSRSSEFQKIRKFFDFQTGEFATFSMRVQFFLPWMGYILPGPTILERFEKYRIGFTEFFGKQIADHKLEIDLDDEDGENKDYVEAYLKEQKRREADGDFETFSNVQLSNMCLDLWFAALMTTSNTTNWGMAYVVNYLEEQKWVQEELDRVVAGDRLITTADRADLQRTQAFLNEIQRCANIVPLNLLHMTTRDTLINGYQIKKGTGVVAQISTVLLDEKAFPDPWKFNPSRFIDEESGKLKKIEEFIPFSIGKRQCPGEGLAKMELFLFFANFLNRYEVLPDENGPPCIVKSELGSMHTKDFNVKLRRRH
ncbi:unnamed protein product [Caenorhabditis angaria]|uniref:CYtochrome P450 family n=1 Tax=Caenorhabditis angaria TaxID=860376 RepID=A0A9P1N4B1_9PELO|nr:unnamed protein product [Caenorhabditis angaria]